MTNDILYRDPCGCRVVRDAEGCRVHIERCALHEAVRELYAACQDISIRLDLMQMERGDSHAEKYRRESIHIAHTVLDKIRTQTYGLD